MIIKFILVVVGLTIVICNPILLFLAAGFGLAWLLFKRPNLFPSLPSYLTTPGRESNEPEENLSREYPTTEEIYAKEVESKLKPGYKDDPKWKDLNDKIKAHNEWVRTRSDADGLIEDDPTPSLEELTNEVV